MTDNGEYKKKPGIGAGAPAIPITTVPRLTPYAKPAFQGPVPTKSAKPLFAGKAGAARAAHLKRMVDPAPQVMVKVSGRKSNAGQLSAHLDYISRNGKIALEDQDGILIAEKDERQDLAALWDEAAAEAWPDRQATRAVALVFSMPEGTDPERLHDAVRDTMAEIAQDHDYVMARHEDTDHPHIHVAVANAGARNRAFTTYKWQLRQMRETFAQELEARQIAAQATPCVFRMVEPTNRHQAVYHMARKYERGEGEAPRTVIDDHSYARSLAERGVECRRTNAQRAVWKKSMAYFRDAADELRESNNPEYRELATMVGLYADNAELRAREPTRIEALKLGYEQLRERHELGRGQSIEQAPKPKL